MLGDELKKALEPIQASDELLEKTRKAIEQARVRQAQETLDKAIRKDARRTLFLKAVIPVACAVLLFAGAILILPKLSTKKSDNERGARGEIQEHNAAIADVVAEIDGIEYEDTKAYVEDTAEASNESAATTEAQVDGAGSDNKGSVDSVESSDSFSLSIDPYYRNKTLMFSPNLSDRLSVKQSVAVGNYTLVISKDEKDLYLNDASTGETVENDSEHAAPSIRDMLYENETISGLLYDESYSLLYISTVEGDTASTDSVHLFICGYEDGKVTKDPERAG